MAIFRKMGDGLKNGTVLGALLGVAIAWGNYLYSFLLINVPASWTTTIPLWVDLIVIGAIVGYVVDRN